MQNYYLKLIREAGTTIFSMDLKFFTQALDKRRIVQYNNIARKEEAQWLTNISVRGLKNSVRKQGSAWSSWHNI
jgi:hypothetical protein